MIASDDAPTARLAPCVSPRCVEHAPDLLEEVAVLLLDPEQLRHLARDDRQRDPDDEALEHGLGDQRGQEPEPHQTGDQRRQAGRDREPGRQRRASVPPWD